MVVSGDYGYVVFFALLVEFTEEVFEFYFLFWGDSGAKLFAALLADLFFLGVNWGVEGFPLGAGVVDDYGNLLLLVRGWRFTSWVRRAMIASRDFGAVWWPQTRSPHRCVPRPPSKTPSANTTVTRKAASRRVLVFSMFIFRHHH